MLKSGQGDLLAIGGFIALAAIVFLLLSGPREVRLSRSTVGFEGLASWLDRDDTEARFYRGQYPLRLEEYGFRVLPLHDTDITRTREEPKTDQQLIFQLDEVDRRLGVIAKKVENLPTLLALPKWRTGARLIRIAHPTLLADIAASNRIAKQLPLQLGSHDLSAKFTERFDYRASDGRVLSAMIYAPQTYAAPACEPIIGTKERLVLGDCKWGRDDARVFLLADPDLFNNHGLSLGDNAEIAADFFADAAGDKPILVDYSSREWTAAERSAPRPERTWSDLLKYFEPPFTLIWFSVGVAVALLLWRASVRWGAPLASPDDAPAAARKAAIEAKARLLRLGGHDAALLAAQAEQRLSIVAADIFGAHAPQGATPLSAICGFLERRGANEAAQRLEQASSRLSVEGAGDMAAALSEFETILSEVQREFGRPTRSG
ncbi:MAG: hypothetical protein AAF401_00895 [Pseudomonadota bacterium]